MKARWIAADLGCELAATAGGEAAAHPPEAGGLAAGGTGWPCTRSSVGSMQAQLGALAAQMFRLSCTDEGSSRLPTRTTRNSGRAFERANKCVPQVGQTLVLLELVSWLILQKLYLDF